MKKLIGAEVKSLQNMVSRHIENKEKEMGERPRVRTEFIHTEIFTRK